jgi:hypothetical protein
LRPETDIIPKIILTFKSRKAQYPDYTLKTPIPVIKILKLTSAVICLPPEPTVRSDNEAN